MPSIPSELRTARKLSLLRELVKHPHKFWDLRELTRPVMPSTSLRELVQYMEKHGFVRVDRGMPRPRNPNPWGVQITIKGIEELDRLLRAQDGD